MTTFTKMCKTPLLLKKDTFQQKTVILSKSGRFPGSKLAKSRFLAKSWLRFAEGGHVLTKKVSKSGAFPT